MVPGGDQMAENRVLIIDDEVHMARVVEQVAKNCGYDAAVTTSPAEFLALLKSWQPSHVVLDLMIPGVDGIELFRSISETGANPQIILISGIDSTVLAGAHRLGLAQGLNIVAAVEKPMRAAELRRVFERVQIGSGTCRNLGSKAAAGRG
jgi:CheY-like chemotaxis protein